MTTVAIIGAGMSGLTLAQKLSAKADVCVFDKSRGVGGRMATRRADDYEFDHGAQFFTAKSKPFQDMLKPFQEAGIVQPWQAKVMEKDLTTGQSRQAWQDPHPRYVAAPRMNSMLKEMTNGLRVELQCEITSLKRQSCKWELMDAKGQSYGPFDWVVLTAPAMQTSALLPEDVSFYNSVTSIQMQACFTLMLGLKKSFDLGWDVLRLKGSPIAWIARNQTKPGRKELTSLVVHAHNHWSQRHIDDDRSEVQEILLESLSSVLEIDLSQIDHIALHGWRYARGQFAQTYGSLKDENRQIAVCADWLLDSRVEAAFESACHLYDQLKDRL